jgi:hypothetical protein
VVQTLIVVLPGSIGDQSPQSAHGEEQHACESSDIANNLGQSPPGSGGHDEYQAAEVDRDLQRLH